MPEARDRFSRAADIAVIYARRRQSIVSGGYERSPTISPLVEDPTEVVPTTPFRWRATPLTGTRGVMGLADASVVGGITGIERGGSGTSRIWRGNMSPRTVIGRGSTSPATRSSRGRGRGRGRGRRDSVLPHWYPRVPLQDITEIVRAMERRRASTREGEGPQVGSPIPQERTALDPAMPVSGAQLEHSTPYPTIGFSRSRSVSVPKILFDITNQNDGESAGLTPQKKLLNSIDIVDKVVTEELRKMKRTPAAKKAEREKKVRTLMSMR